MIDQPRDLAAEVDGIDLAEEHRRIRRDHDQWYHENRMYDVPQFEWKEHQVSIHRLLEYIAALSRELEDLRRPLAELKKEAESEEGMEPQRMMQYLCRRVDALQKATRRLQPDNERLRAENERLSRDYNTARDAHDRRSSELAEVQSQLTALRRPLEQSADVESIRAHQEKYRPLFDPDDGRVAYDFFKNVDSLLSALDTTARQLRERVEMLEAAQGEIAELREASIQWQRTTLALEQEIARLSSPPPERREIVERQACRKDCLANGDAFGAVIATRDIDTLLQDLRRYENSHAIVMGERDAARERCERLQQQGLDIHQKWTERYAEAVRQKTRAHDRAREMEERIDRLEGALERAYYHLDMGELKVSHLTDHDMIEAALAETDASALAASQQHTAGSGDGVADRRQRDIVAVDHEGKPVYAISDEEFRRMNPQPSATGDGMEGDNPLTALLGNKDGVFGDEADRDFPNSSDFTDRDG